MSKLARTVTAAVFAAALLGASATAANADGFEIGSTDGWEIGSTDAYTW